MKKWSGGVLITALALVLFLSYTLIGRSESPKKKQSAAYDFFNPQPPEPDPNASASAETKTETTKAHLRSLRELDDLYSLGRNLSRLNPPALLAWGQMKFLFPRSDALPQTDQGIKEALVMCRDLLVMIEEEEGEDKANSNARDCPGYVNTPTPTNHNSQSLEIPCGLVEDSSVTVIGIPDSHARQHSFQIELIGSPFEGTAPPIVLRYTVVLPGENLTKEPLILQNGWTQESGWGKEERCPPHHAPPSRLHLPGTNILHYNFVNPLLFPTDSPLS